VNNKHCSTENFLPPLEYYFAVEEAIYQASDPLIFLLEENFVMFSIPIRIIVLLSLYNNSQSNNPLYSKEVRRGGRSVFGLIRGIVIGRKIGIQKSRRKEARMTEIEKANIGAVAIIKFAIETKYEPPTREMKLGAIKTSLLMVESDPEYRAVILTPVDRGLFA
jgi:hypothetical protein